MCSPFPILVKLLLKLNLRDLLTLASNVYRKRKIYPLYTPKKFVNLFIYIYHLQSVSPPASLEREPWKISSKYISPLYLRSVV